MHLRRLLLVNFRNYSQVKIDFSSNVNFFYGLNAAGKTNLLEAIYLLCLGRSFRLAKNQELIKRDTENFIIEGELTLDNGIEKLVIVNYIRNLKKEVSLNKKRLKGYSEIFGQFPIVVMAPDEFKITLGGPTERRRFLDILLSQVSPLYLANLQEYNRILKQRNKILQSIRNGHFKHQSSLDPWTENLIKIGIKIITDRLKVIDEFSPILSSIFKRFGSHEDEVEISIKSTTENKNGEVSEESFREALFSQQTRERAMGLTFVGPHRDDMLMKVNGLEMRRYGSRGEHKSLLIALKIAEFKYLQEKKNEKPIMLLDDCYSELDDRREKSAFDSILGLGQIFLTSPKKMVTIENSSESVQKFKVENGYVERY